jgi:hypothetical protein
MKFGPTEPPPRPWFTRNSRKKLENKLAAAHTPDIPKAKDIWDKLGTLTTAISSIVIAGAGIVATYIYNERQLQLGEIDKQREEARLEAQMRSTSQVEQTKLLVSLYDYISSDNASKRAFGYEMFSIFGQGELAIKILASKADPDFAGLDSMRYLAKSKDQTIAVDASFQVFRTYLEQLVANNHIKTLMKLAEALNIPVPAEADSIHIRALIISYAYQYIYTQRSREEQLKRLNSLINVIEPK